MPKFKESQRGLTSLLPASVDDYVPEDHLACFIVDIVDKLDLTALAAGYSGRGKAAYHPSVMVALLFYSYASGVFTSRRIEEACRDRLSFRHVTGNLVPDHDTIASFRKRFGPLLDGIFLQILQLAREAGFLRLGRVSLDGTKIRADASRHKALSHGYAERLERQLRAEVETLMRLAAEREAEEEGRPAGGDLDIAEELKRRESRLAEIGRAKAEIERRAAERDARERAEYEERMRRRAERERETGRKPGGRPPREPGPGPRAGDQVNLTDGESRIMPTSNGFQQCYNAQASVDEGSHLVVGAHVSVNPNDKLEVEPALAELSRAEAAVGRAEGLLADSGYFSRGNVEACDAAGIEPSMAEGRQRHNRPLELDPAEPEPCPAGADAVGRMRQRMGTIKGKAVYARRKATVETVFGVIKETLGFRQFSMRGHAAAGFEWRLVCTAWNLKRLHALSMSAAAG